jgi:tetratricopeptide (TPR) repeat protein
LKNTDQSERASFLSSLDQYRERGLDQMALSQTVERLNRFPFDTELKMVYCDILMKMGRKDEAYRLIQELEDTFLKLSKIYAHLGDIHKDRGLSQKAFSFYEKFLSLNPDSKITDEICEKMNDLRNREDIETVDDGADENYDINELAPHFRTLTMAELYIRQGHLDAATDILKEILKDDPGNAVAADRLREITNGNHDDSADMKSRKGSVAITKLEKWMKKIRRVKNYAT